MTDQTAEPSEASEQETVVEEQKTEVVEQATTDDAVDDTTEPKPQSKFDKRIGQLTGENYALKSDRDYWRDRALTKEPDPPVKEPEVEAPTRPILKDFDNDIAQYADALGEYTEKAINHAADVKAKEITEQATAARTDEANQTAAQQRIQTFNERSQDFAKEHEDYFDIVGNPTLNITQEMTDIITEMENGPEIVYHLGKHPEIAFRISQKSSVAAALELSKLVTTAPVSSDAPEPPSTIGTSRGVASKDESKMSTKEWMAYRNKQVRKSNG